MTATRLLAAACLFFVLAASAASAHHSLALFNRKQVVTLQGRITKVEWKSPHTMIFIEATQASGEVAEWRQPAEWRIETVPVSWLTNNGWTRESLKAGEDVTTNVYSYEDKTARYGFLLSIIKPDGTTLKSPLDLGRQGRGDN
jgi:hypothetical protein